MIGAGVIGRTVLMAVKAVVDIQQMEVYAVHRENKIKFVREMQEERIFFNPVGMGIQDLIVAHRIYETANERNIWQKLMLWKQPLWV